MLLVESTGAAAQTPDSGRQVFTARCAGCHGTDGNGGELGPGIATRVPTRTDQELTTLVPSGPAGVGHAVVREPDRDRVAPRSFRFCGR